MTTMESTQSAFALDSQQGRTPEPLDILGEEVHVKLSSADTNAAVAVFHMNVPPMTGPPLHRHSREDEWFYVVEGTMVLEIDGERFELQSGGSAFAPRGTVHAYQNFSDATVRMLVMVTPGGFNNFFEEVSALNAGRENPDLAGLQDLMTKYGMEILGPPLS